MAATFSGWNKKIEQIENEVNNLKKSVSDGKNAVATAITNKGVATAGDAAFATMATNIGKISTLGADTADGNAVAGDILNGKTAYVKGTKVTGNMANLTANTPIKYTSTNNTKVIKADNLFLGTNTDGVNRLCLRYNGNDGLITGNTLFGLDYASAANHIGLTANKIAQGQNILGIAGTYTSDANATTAQIASGKTAYVKGQKVTGTATTVEGLRIGSTRTNSPYYTTYINSANANQGTLTLKDMGQTSVSNPDMYEHGYYDKLAGFPSSTAYIIWDASDFILDVKKKIVYKRTYDDDGFVGVVGTSIPNLTFSYSSYVTVTFNPSGGYLTAKSSNIDREDGLRIDGLDITWIY